MVPVLRSDAAPSGDCLLCLCVVDVHKESCNDPEKGPWTM
jgi:hypothetical protein